MDYWEDLPDQCPPVDSVDDAIALAYRLVFSDPASIEHFKSHAALGKPPLPSVDGCRWASCSLFTSKDAVASIGRLPKMRAKGPHVAHVSIPQGSGKWKASGNHVDLWMYAGFDPLSAVQLVEAL